MFEKKRKIHYCRFGKIHYCKLWKIHVCKTPKIHVCRIWENPRLQSMGKSIFAKRPLSNAWFFNPKHPDADPKNFRKNNLEASMKRYMFCPRCLKGLQNEVQNLSKVNKNRSLDLKVSFVVLPSVPGLSQGPSGATAMSS